MRVRLQLNLYTENPNEAALLDYLDGFSGARRAAELQRICLVGFQMYVRGQSRSSAIVNALEPDLEYALSEKKSEPAFNPDMSLMQERLSYLERRLEEKTSLTESKDKVLETHSLDSDGEKNTTNKNRTQDSIKSGFKKEGIGINKEKEIEEHSAIDSNNVIKDQYSDSKNIEEKSSSENSEEIIFVQDSDKEGFDDDSPISFFDTLMDEDDKYDDIEDPLVILS